MIDEDNNPTGNFDEAKLKALAKKHGGTIKFDKQKYDPAKQKVEALDPVQWNPAQNTSLFPPGLDLPKTQTIKWAKLVAV